MGRGDKDNTDSDLTAAMAAQAAQMLRAEQDQQERTPLINGLDTEED